MTVKRKVRVDFVAPIHMDPAREDGILATPDPATGFLRLEGRMTRTGVFRYRDADGNEWGELRTAEEVFAPESLDSFRGVVVTDDHPDRFVDIRNVRDVQVGHVGTDVRQEGDFVRASVLVTDAQAIVAIQRGKCELSCGYTAEMVEDAGELDGQPFVARQTNIRGNHLAIVDVGRAGPECRLLNRGDGSAVSVSREVEQARGDGRRDAERTNESAPARRDAQQEEATMDLAKLIRDALDALKKAKDAAAARKLVSDTATKLKGAKLDQEAGGKLEQILALLNAAAESGQPLLMEAALGKVGDLIGGAAPAEPSPDADMPEEEEEASASAPATPPPAAFDAGQQTGDGEDVVKLRARVDSLEEKRKADEAAFAARVDARVKLVADARAVCPDLDPVGKSDADIMRSVVLAVFPDAGAKLDANESAPGYLKARYEDALELHAKRDQHAGELLRTTFDAAGGTADAANDPDAVYRDFLKRIDERSKAVKRAS